MYQIPSFAILTVKFYEINQKKKKTPLFPTELKKELIPWRLSFNRVLTFKSYILASNLVNKLSLFLSWDKYMSLSRAIFPCVNQCHYLCNAIELWINSNPLNWHANKQMAMEKGTCILKVLFSLPLTPRTQKSNKQKKPQSITKNIGLCYCMVFIMLLMMQPPEFKFAHTN